MSAEYCWYCHWGWPKPIYDIYRKYVDLLGAEYFLESGPAHIVWGDENFDRENVEYLLGLYDQKHPLWEVEENFTPERIEIIRQSLIELLTLPKEYLNDRFQLADEVDAVPPPSHWVMVKNGKETVYA